MITPNDTYWMRRALLLAKKSQEENEVPVGAIIVEDDRILAGTHNLTLTDQDACAHAEMLALKTAFGVKKNYRLNHATMYITLEPCCMCAGALVHARVARVVFGAYDKRVGAAGSVFNILGDPRHYHQPKIMGGCLQGPCEKILKDFFSERRKT